MRSVKLGKPLFLNNSLIFLIASALFIFAGLIHRKTKKPELKLTKQTTALNLNSDFLVYLSAGNKRLISDLIWIQTLLESDLDHYQGEEKLNWMFLRFNTISRLDPYFYENYHWGGQYLAIIKDDLPGGIQLLTKGLNYYPQDYKLNYLLGFSHYYELGNYEQGIYYLEKIIDHPRAPFFLKNIVLKMKIEKGFSMEAGMELLQTQLDQTDDETFKRKLGKDLYALKAEKDLKCLNQKKINCDVQDIEGTPYILKNDQYFSPKYFVPYRLSKKNKRVKATEVNTL